MRPNQKTTELNQTLAKFQEDENDAALKQAIDDAVKEGYEVTLYYRGGGYQKFGDEVAIVTPHSMVGDPIHIEAERPGPAIPKSAVAELTAEDRQHIEKKLDESHRHLTSAFAAISGLHLFDGWMEHYREMEKPTLAARDVVWKKLDGIRRHR